MGLIKGLIQLIFEPGFSTAQELTEISGRGVCGADATCVAPGITMAEVFTGLGGLKASSALCD